MLSKLQNVILRSWKQFEAHMKNSDLQKSLGFWHPDGKDIFVSMFGNESKYFIQSHGISVEIAEEYPSCGVLNVCFAGENKKTIKRYGYVFIDDIVYFLWAPSIVRRIKTRGWKQLSTHNLTYCYNNGDFDCERLEADTSYMEEFFKKIQSSFEVTIKQKINVYICYSFRELQEFSGKNFAGGAAIDPILLDIITQEGLYRQYIPHEIVHIASRFWGGWPPVILREGLAVAMTEIPYIPLFNEQRNIKPVTYLFNPENFRNYMDIDGWPYSYAFAGALVLYLIETHGISLFKKYYNECNSNNFQIIFKSIYGHSFIQFEEKWRNWLETNFFCRFTSDKMEVRKRLGLGKKRRTEYYLKLS